MINRELCACIPGTCCVIRRKDDVVIKGLRPALEGFVVMMHEGTCDHGVLGPLASELKILFERAWMLCVNKARQTDLHHDYNMTSRFRPMNVSVLFLKKQKWWSNRWRILGHILFYIYIESTLNNRRLGNRSVSVCENTLFASGLIWCQYSLASSGEANGLLSGDIRP